MIVVYETPRLVSIPVVKTIIALTLWQNEEDDKLQTGIPIRKDDMNLKIVYLHVKWMREHASKDQVTVSFVYFFFK